MHKQGFGHTGKRDLPEGELKYQIRINLSEEFAAVASRNVASPELLPLLKVLREFDAHLKQQGSAFVNFLPYFKNEEQDAHLGALGMAMAKMQKAGKVEGTQDVLDAWKAAAAADDTDDVDATLEAMKGFRAATNALIERHADNASVADYKEAVDQFIERYCRLYLWTKETVQQKFFADGSSPNGFYSTRFSIYANGGQEVYDKDIADKLEEALKPLKESGMIKIIHRFDSDPANNPQAPEKFHI